MKKMEFKGQDLNYYIDKLENGLEVVMIPMENKKNYFITYATRFGSDITSFATNNSKKEKKYPDGIAHFLEHKMFEQEDGVDPFTFFSESGTGSNASTSFDYTQYICYGTKNFKENLRYLIKFVNSPFYTDENVEKEKGIIAEEIKMYEDVPDFKLEMRLRENLFSSLPRRVDIGGSIKEINKITKEDLYNCYNNFYTPNNMFIIIVGNFNVKEASKIISEELELKENVKTPKIKEIIEKKQVRLKKEEITGNIEIPKVAFGLKQSIKDFAEYDKVDLDLYLSMISKILFGSSSTFKENAIENNLLNNLYIDSEDAGDYKIFFLMADSNNPEKLLKEIKKEIKAETLDQETFERMKKVSIANEVRISDDVSGMVRTAFNDILYYKEIIDNRIDRIRRLNYDDLMKIYNKIDKENTASIIMMPKKQN